MTNMIKTIITIATVSILIALNTLGSFNFYDICLDITTRLQDILDFAYFLLPIDYHQDSTDDFINKTIYFMNDNNESDNSGNSTGSTGSNKASYGNSGSEGLDKNETDTNKRLNDMDKKLDKIRHESNTRLLSLEWQLHDINDNLNNNCDDIIKKLDSINNKFDSINDRFNDMKDRCDSTNNKFNEINNKLDKSIDSDKKGKGNNNDNGFNNRSPLDQFLIKDLILIIIPLIANVYVSYTNMALYLTIAFLLVIFTYLLTMSFKIIKTSHWYLSIESVYFTIHSIVINQINTIKGQAYFPFMYCLFVFILVNNLIGMIPYSFAPTSHFILTFFISFTIVFGATILGFVLHKLYFFSLLVPNGCPLGLLPLLVLIETISYLARNVSLGLRLAANILSGHMLLNILSEFTYKIMDTNIIYFFIGIIPLTFIGAFSALELGIAFIQSQVFVVLSSSYTKDSIDLH